MIMFKILHRKAMYFVLHST